MTGAATHRPAARPETAGWEVRPAREEDAPDVADAVASLVAELGGSPPPRAAIEAEARAHLADPTLGIVLVATAAPPADPAADPADPAVDPADPPDAADPAERSQFAAHSAANCERTGAGGGELVGVLTASWARAIQVAGRLLTIEVLWTRRELRDQGVGARLVDALAAAAAAEGAGRVEVGLPRESFAALRATERFYLANGFERLGPRMRRALP